jgi:DNA topoisomerase-3
MDPDLVEKALEKLWIHGGAAIDAEDRVTLGARDWEKPYQEQRLHKREQLDQVSRFADGRACHMLQLVRHFGDQADSGEACGHCASCSPEATVALAERSVTPEERGAMDRILDALRERDGQSKGRLHRMLFGDDLDRRSFELMLGGLIRAHLVSELEDCFESEGKTIHFRRLQLTEAGRRIRSNELDSLRVAVQPKATKSRKTAGSKAGRRPRSGSRRKLDGATRTRSDSGRPRSAKGAKSVKGAKSAKAGSHPASDTFAEAPPRLVEALRDWRLKEARRRRCPAFRILTDRALLGIATEIPRNEDSLLDVKGMGPTLVKKYGAKILEITNEC